jgi:hypothetical protein
MQEQTLNSISDFEFHQSLSPLKHVINIILEIKYMGVLHKGSSVFSKLALVVVCPPKMTILVGRRE